MKKTIKRIDINTIRGSEENFFSLPEAAARVKPPKYMKFKYAGLKPNTRYKIALDNQPGEIFEDITKWSRPRGGCFGVNLPTNKEQQVKRSFIKTNDLGELEWESKPFGTDAAKVSAPNTFTPPHLGSPITSSLPDYTDYWEQLGSRSAEDDKGRNRVRVIEYSDFADPSSDSPIKDVVGDVPTIPIDVLPGTRSNPRIEIPIGADVYQTFFIDSKSVQGEDCVDITDITLYFRRKPRRKNNLSGIPNPGVTVTLMRCKEDGTPEPTSAFKNSFTTKTWASIQASSTAEIGTIFTFSDPIRVPTNAYYAISVDMQDQDYILWENRKGDLLIVDGNRTEGRSTGSTKEHNGDMYDRKSFSKNASATAPAGELSWNPNKDKDLKFDVNIARYRLDDVSVDMCLKNYEFLSMSNTTPRWSPSEIVYKDVTPFSGTCTITAGKQKIVGDGSANFSGLVDGDKLVMIDSTDNSIVEVFTVDTSLFAPTATEILVEEPSPFTISGSLLHTVVAEVDFFNTLYDTIRLINSSVNRDSYLANNSAAFIEGDTIIGTESFNSGYIDAIGSLPVSVFRCNFNGEVPPVFDLDTKYNFSVFAESSNSYSLQTDDTLMYLNAPNKVRGYQSEILSKSLEVTQVALANNNNKSATFNITYTYNGEKQNTFCCPKFSTENLQIVTHRWAINNDSTNEYKADHSGEAISKMVSKKLVFNEDRKAEDLKVIANVHTPLGTSVEFYAKVYNSTDIESFEDKQWTKLFQYGGAGIFDDKNNNEAFHEVEYQIPFFPRVRKEFEGVITTTNSTLLTFEGWDTDQLDSLSQGQVVKLHSTLFPTNYQLFSVESANSAAGTVTLQQEVSNTSMIGDGFKLSITEQNGTAFRNPDNFEVTRYFGNNGEIYDTFDEVSVKIVLLSTSPNVVPKVDDYRVIGVSA